jgi:hypothetical protein
MRKCRRTRDDKWVAGIEDSVHADRRVSKLRSAEATVTVRAQRPLAERTHARERETRMTPHDDECALVEAFLDSYVWWRAACDDVWGAYSAWVDCEPGEAARRFASYESALDREETTAIIHHERTRQLSALALERFRGP